MTYLGGVFQDGKLVIDVSAGPAQIDALRSGYGKASPFPNMVIDNFLSPELTERLSDNFPPPALASVSRISQHQYLKRGYRPLSLGEHPSAELLKAFNSKPVIALMEALTGHQNLVADPDFVGGGFHEIERGGHLDVHTDFNLHPQMRLIRRINLIIFLNREWDQDWGGALELWPSDMRACAVSVLPIFNRAVIFDTGKMCFHGHPAPLKLPKGLTRRSMALYFYSAQTAADNDVGTATNWRNRPEQSTLASKWMLRARRAWRAIGN
ncbi:2OG-Fe(II) oxygenase [Parasphingorhabdus sp.]|uniref:2OG-Fe(II) oxygenase n=1 Tax=Parasphingorhabdus sp. TaxID=2709688 RepID=UPI002B271AF7|nr:2OG-Fe(II) oxygenase [Parasphingorhabdus sp.]